MEDVVVMPLPHRSCLKTKNLKSMCHMQENSHQSQHVTKDK